MVPQSSGSKHSEKASARAKHFEHIGFCRGAWDGWEVSILPLPLLAV